MRGLLIRSALVRVFTAAAFLVAAYAFVGAASAATIVKANNSTSLSAGPSWLGGIAPGILDVAQWNSTATGSNTTTLGTGFYLGEISILNPGGPVTVNADGNTLGLYGINGMGIDMSNATQNLTLNCPVLLGSTQTWNVASGQALSVGGVVSGNFGLNLAGNGSTVLTGNNTFTGPVTVNGGTVTFTGNNAYTGGTTIYAGTFQLGAAGVLGGGNYFGAISNNGALVMNTSSNQTFNGVISGNGALYQNGSNVTTLAGSNSYTGNTTIGGGTLAINGAGLLGGGNYSAAIANNGALVVNTSSNQALGGVISGNGVLYQLGSGVTTLTGANSYTGGTTINAGTLNIANSAGSATGTGTVTINAGTLSSGVGGLGIISGAVVCGTGAVTISPGGNGTIGQLNVGSLVTNSGTTFNFDLNAPGGSGDLINVTGGSLTFAAGTVLNVNNPGSLVSGTYRLFQYASGTTTVTGSGNLAVAGLLPRQAALTSFVPDATPGYLDLSVGTAASIASSWNVNAGGSWTTAANWTGSVIPAIQGDVANLGTSLTTAGTITLDSQPQVGSLSFNPSGTGSYTVSAGSAASVLVMNNTGSTAFINNQAKPYCRIVKRPRSLAGRTSQRKTSMSRLARLSRSALRGL